MKHINRYFILFAALFVSSNLFSENQKTSQDAWVEFNNDAAEFSQRTKQYLLLTWEIWIREKGTSYDILKGHFPEICEILESCFSTGSLDADSFKKLSDFFAQGNALLIQLNDSNKCAFPAKSKEQSHRLLCDLVYGTFIVTARRNSLNNEINNSEDREIVIDLRGGATGGLILGGTALTYLAWRYFFKK